MPGNLRVYLVGLLLLIFSLAVFIASIYLAVNGYIVASLVGAAIGSVTLIVGADLVRGS
ncbi:MAG: hypothetical protein F7C82_00135 [Desulfurococcales archaeon]|nr:hypothetical protein [Desulfurococcales archaeon]MCE4622521.1 hypothetical protein [Desulfurococcales archaeon]MCE4626546.1 hypothetical protein [Desulfurococcales archaeon]MCE4628670.1 hypothetical protein [Desulfurococcales archaeon]